MISEILQIPNAMIGHVQALVIQVDVSHALDYLDGSARTQALTLTSKIKIPQCAPYWLNISL